MSRKTYGIIAGIVGSALGAWYWNRYRLARGGRRNGNGTARERGTVIFDNTPSATELSEGVI